MSEDYDRLVMELEFIQCLANPAYLSCKTATLSFLVLSQQGLFNDSKFIAYLHYLQYWHQPAYAALLSYQNALFFLKALLDDSFRRELSNPDCITHIHRQQYHHWLHQRNK